MVNDVDSGGIVDKNTTKNKTGTWRTFDPKVDEEKCKGCGVCIDFCPEHIIKIVEKNGKKKAEIDRDFCKGCMICASVCPLKAITIEKEEEK